MALLSSITIFASTTPSLLLVFSFALGSLALIAKRMLRAIKPALPGPKLAKWTDWWIRWSEVTGKSVQEIHRLHREHGSIVQVGPREISFCHADALRAIYTGPRGLDAGRELDFLRQYGSENLVSTIDAGVHATRRKRVAGLYSGPVVAAPEFRDTLRTYVDRFMAAVEQDAAESPSRTVNVFPWLKRLTSDIMIQLVFGPEKSLDLLRNDNSRKRFKELITTSNSDDDVGPALAPFILLFPSLTTWVLEAFQPEPEINAFAMECVKEAAISENALPSGGNSRATHLQHLLSMYNKDGPSIAIPDTTYIASDCLDHFFAGSETTTDLMTAAIWRLSFPENRDHQERLRQELCGAGVSSADAEPDISALQQLPFLTNVLRETLRLDSPIPFKLPRVVKEGQDVEIMDIKIPPRTQISVPIYSLHRDPETFEDPETWNPDRWSLPLTSPTYKQMLRSLIPFGTGARMCTGMNVAWSETRLLLARIYSTYETCLDQVWLDESGAPRPESQREGLYPRTVEEPIEFRKVVQ